MEHTDLELYIQIRDGEPYEHPIFADNFKLAFPEVDVNNLPKDKFARFIRVLLPALSAYEIHEGSVYAWDNDVVKDVHIIRQMTDEERAAKTAELEAIIYGVRDKRIMVCNTMINKFTGTPEENLWKDCLLGHENWEYTSLDPFAPDFPNFPTADVEPVTPVRQTEPSEVI